MANIQRIRKAPVTLDLDGQSYKLKFTLGSLAYLEEEFGDIQKAFSAAEAGSCRAIIKILFAGMKHGAKELTEDDVADMIDLGDLAYVTERLGEAMNQDMPQAVEGKTQSR